MDTLRVTFIPPDKRVTLQINSVSVEDNSKVTGCKIVVITASIEFSGVKEECDLYFSLVPENAQNLLLTVSIGDEFQTTYFLTDSAFSFTNSSGSANFHDHQSIIRLFKSRVS